MKAKRGGTAATRRVARHTRKKPGRMQRLRLHLGVFDYTVRVVLTEDRHAAVRWIRGFLEDPRIEDERLDQNRGCVFHREGYAPVIWLPRKPRTPVEHATLAHEAMHVTRFVMLWAGIALSDDSEEVWTHTTGSIVKAVLTQAR